MCYGIMVSYWPLSGMRVCQSHVCDFRYMCNMSDDNLRQAGGKGVTEMVMTLIKESNPIKALFDREYLKLSFKYFSCSTLKIRMAGLQQLNVSVSFIRSCVIVNV